MLALTAADYAMLIPLTLASLTTMIVTIIAALRTTKIQYQVTPPSEPVKGGRTLGDLVEGTQVNAHAAALDAGRARHAIADPKTGLAAIHGEVQAVGSQVATGNGQTIGMLADIAEGRAAQAIPIAERTHEEQTHVDMKEAAHPAPETPTP